MNKKPIDVIAIHLAEKYHAGQKYGDAPYTRHLCDVVENLTYFNFDNNLILVAAAFLHDILEDTKATPQDLLAAGIPQNVIDVVWAVTDGPGNNRLERKLNTYPKIRASRRATIVKLADRIANIESIEGGAKIDMYRAEHTEFRKALYNDDFDLKPMEDHLDKLLGF
jgi:guanosine-3',5'-bis(diphosphate) 3'-pyrophosphohydrolase